MNPDDSWKDLSKEIKSKIKESFDAKWAELFESIITNSDPSWRDFLERKKVKDALKSALLELADSRDFFPNKLEDVFHFMQIDIKKAKCAIIGQDPYPQPEVATGKSFEIHELKRWEEVNGTMALAKIWKALYYYSNNLKGEVKINIKDVKNIFKMPFNPSEWFDDTEEKGILWMNAALTVKPNNPESHWEIWEDFMVCVFAYLLENKIKLFPLGKEARERVQKALDCVKEKHKEHQDIEIPIIRHPIQRYKGDREFVREMAKRCFEAIDRYYEENGEHRIFDNSKA